MVKTLCRNSEAGVIKPGMIMKVKDRVLCKCGMQMYDCGLRGSGRGNGCICGNDFGFFHTALIDGILLEAVIETTSEETIEYKTRLVEVDICPKVKRLVKEAHDLILCN